MLVSITIFFILLVCLSLVSALHYAVSTIRGSVAASVTVPSTSSDEDQRGRRKSERLLIALRLAWGLCFAGLLIAADGAPRNALANALSSLLPAEESAATVALVLVTLTTVLLAVLIGEILPAAIAAQDPAAVAARLTRPISVALKVLGPLPRLIHRAVKRLCAAREGASADGTASEDDIRHLAQEVHEAGVIEEGEREIIDRVFKLGDRPVASVMTPRADVVALSVSAEPKALLERALDSGLTRFPVVGQSDDEVLGIVTLQALVSLHTTPESFPAGLLSLIETPLQVPESMTALQLLELFREKGQRLAVIVDEYGGFAGVATLTDVLEVLIGEIKSDSGQGQLIVERPDGSLLVDSSIDIEDLFEELGLRTDQDASSGEFHSLGGFVMSSLGHVPNEGESFESFGHRFEVVDMDGNRIDKVLVSAAIAKCAVG